MRRITPQNPWCQLPFRTWWSFRHVFAGIIRRDIAIHYKQTYFGVLWVLLKAAIEVCVFTFVFHTHLRIDSGSVPYPLFVMVGVLVWSFVSAALSSGVTSLFHGRIFIQRIAFPRILLPFASVSSRLIDLGASLFFFIVLLLWFKAPMTWSALLAVPILLLLVLFLVGVVSIVTSLHVQYRDIGFFIPYLTRIGLFLSPVVYSIDSIDQKWHWMFYMNPAAGAIESLRSVFFGTVFPTTLFGVSALLSILVFLIGILFFQKREPHILNLL